MRAATVVVTTETDEMRRPADRRLDVEPAEILGTKRRLKISPLGTSRVRRRDDGALLNRSYRDSENLLTNFTPSFTPCVPVARLKLDPERHCAPPP
jgi:hypothetical protein